MTTTEIIIRISVAVILASCIGIERSLAGKSAGMRTYAMAALGSSAFSIISQVIQAPALVAENPLYLASAVITGIGFIGAGIVLFQEQSHRGTGLTTAVGIWVSAGVGLASGYGLFNLALATTIVAIVILTGFWFVERAANKFSYRKGKGDEEMM
jgi:putative Mg2+ transporter-C (MgtC) family protein